MIIVILPETAKSAQWTVCVCTATGLNQLHCRTGKHQYIKWIDNSEMSNR